jgi:SPX domain protein involved in polyphosphate accumulation
MAAFIFPSFNENSSRYERKFVVKDMYFAAIEQQIRIHPAAFSPIFYPRYINNIYLDTNEMDFFNDNVAGKGSRKKARIRWYADQMGEVAKPVLEFKVREGMLGNKISYRLRPFEFNEAFNLEKLLQVFDESEIPTWAREVLYQLKPALVNRYRRHYFMSFDTRFRITLDDELSYYSIRAENNYYFEKHENHDTIVELKYERKYDDVAPKVSNKLPFRLTKSSKYVNGMEILHPFV